MPKRSRKQQRVDQKIQKRQALDGTLKTTWNDFEGEEEIDLESMPRRFKEDDEDQDSLPVIVDGKVRRVVQKVSSKKQDEASESEESEAEEQPAEDEEEEEEVVELSEREIREKIADFAELLNEEPEEHIGKLRELQTLALRSRKARTRQLLILSLLTVYKDLIPGYNIKPLTEAQAKEKVTKDVRKLREYEQQFISYYKTYVDLLVQSFRQGKGETEGKRYSVASTAIFAACELLERAPWFNFRMDLIKLVVEKLSSQRLDKPYTQCITTVQVLFEEDDEGHVSFEVVQQIAKMIKQRRYKVDSRVLGTLLHLRLLTELIGRGDLERMIKEKPQGEVIRKKDRVHLTKKQRKMRKEQKEIDEEMRKAETAVSAEMREKLQSQTLKMVFVLYFNILKQRSKTLMGATLEGLARFSHLINADLFGDLLEVLREIIALQQVDNTRESLLCIVAAFSLLSGQVGESMNLDLTFFINHLYRILFTMAFDPHIEQSHKHLENTHKGKLSSETDMLIRSMEALFMKRATSSHVRVLAFSKRMAMCSLYFPERTSMVALNILDQMTKKHPFSKALFSTQDRINKGVYHPEADTPENSNAEVSTIWETALLSKHYNPKVAKAAVALSHIKE